MNERGKIVGLRAKAVCLLLFSSLLVMSLANCGGGGSSSTRPTAPILPSLTLATTSAITQTSAASGGTVTSDGGAAVTARGVVWGTSAAPTTANASTSDGAGTGSFASSITGLTHATLYHVRAYATNSVGTAYSDEATFTTLANLATVATAAVSQVAQTAASSGGNVTDDGGAAVTARGVAWATTANPTTANSVTSDGTGMGSYTSSLTGLTASTTYHVRAYATNSAGTAYGSDVSFSTLAQMTVPTVTTAVPANVLKSSATSGGTITSDGGGTITDAGVVWSAANNPPTIADNKVSGSGTTGTFTASLTGLAMKTTYYLRAYATNAAGTGYGSVQTISTLNQFNLPASVAPLITNLWTVYTWPYDAYFPIDPASGQQALNTCGPTSLAKTLGYWKVTNGTSVIDTYDDPSNPTGSIHWQIDLTQMNINYANVPDSLPATATEAQYHDVATLFLGATAVAEPLGVGSPTPSLDLYPTIGSYFKMSPATHLLHDWEYTATDWMNLVEYELAQGRPIIVDGRLTENSDPWVDGNDDGHSWNVDGYDSNDQIHATYNFYDYNNSPIAGYFPVSSMGPVTIDNGLHNGYTRAHYAVFGFQPEIAATSNPVAETYPANNPTATTVRVSGAVVGEGNSTVIARGFHLSDGTNTFDTQVGFGAGYFYSTLTGLTPGITYTVSAYADTASQRYYGQAQAFTTLSANTAPAEVMPLLSADWTSVAYPYNAALPPYSNGPNGYFYNEAGATALARLLHYWRQPSNGVGAFSSTLNWNGTPVTLQADLSSLNLNYGKMFNRLSSTSTAAQVAEDAKLIAATETFSFGANATGNGNLRQSDPDAYLVPLLIASWGLDPGLTLVEQENYTATAWTQLLQTEIAAGRPVMIIGRTSDSPAPGASGSVNAGWFLVDGYNAAGQFHADFSGALFGTAGEAKGWYDPALLAPTGGYTNYHRALIGFRPKSN